MPTTTKRVTLRRPPAWASPTLDEWRSSDIRTAYVRGLLADPTFRDLLAVLQNTMPVPDISDASRAGLEAARVRGYLTAIHVLLRMAEPIDAAKPEPEVTYDTPVEDIISDEV